MTLRNTLEDVQVVQRIKVLYFLLPAVSKLYTTVVNIARLNAGSQLRATPVSVFRLICSSNNYSSPRGVIQANMW